MQDIIGTLGNQQAESSIKPDLVEASLQAIEHDELKLNSFAHVFSSAARQRVADLAASHTSPRDLALPGIPIGIKDNVDTAGTPTSAGSPALEHMVAASDAVVVTRLQNQGAIVVGKQRMSEAAITDHSESYPMPKNPWDESLWTGTSSSGSAAAVAAGMVYASIATDTGGSLRYPAVMHGLTSIKPSWGRVSQEGVVPLAKTLDHPGPLARSARDCALLLEVITDDNQKWFEEETNLVDRIRTELARDTAPPVIGTVRSSELTADTATADRLSDALRVMEDLGARSTNWAYPDEAWYGVQDWPATVATEFATYLGEHYRKAGRGSYGEEVESYLALAEAQTPADLVRRTVRREELRAAIRSSMKGVDFLLLPVLSFIDADSDHMDEFVGSAQWQEKVMKYVVPFNFAGMPSVAFPVGFGEKGPIGLQLVGKPGEELELLRLVNRYQEVTPHHQIFDRVHLT